HMSPSRLLIALSLTLLAAAAAVAQPVYRCGSTYTQTPCPASGRIVDASDARSDSQRAEALRLAADERRLAAEMRRDRLAEQAALRPAGAASLSGSARTVVLAAAPPLHPKRRAGAKRGPFVDEVVMIERAPRKGRAAGG
ncbi:MAG TPA: hypothetical protein VNU71_19035, partial [Burkholderiaceae bacterium]|nr:hypothetical protein [Burkholderiaceae bacterium]